MGGSVRRVWGSVRRERGCERKGKYMFVCGGAATQIMQYTYRHRYPHMHPPSHTPPPHKTGLVLSVAPLLGAEASIDQQHGRWLHVHVRPHVRGLLKVIKVGCVGSVLGGWGNLGMSGSCSTHQMVCIPTNTHIPTPPHPQTSHMGNVWINLGRQLVDGHWVLAFPTPERAWHAKQLLDQHTARLRAFYCDIMSPCQPEDQPGEQ